MIEIKIVNLRSKQPKHSYDFIVDRRSLLGNPYKVNRFRTREQSIKKYRKYFQKKIKKDSRWNLTMATMLTAAVKHQKLRLFCWCHPLPCHAEVIKEYLEGRLNMED